MSAKHQKRLHAMKKKKLAAKGADKKSGHKPLKQKTETKSDVASEVSAHPQRLCRNASVGHVFMFRN